MMKFPLTLRSLLERAAKLFPNVEIVSSRPDNSIHRYTYGEMCRRAGSLAAVLQAAGLKRGDRVASLMWNHYAHLEAYFGVPCAGGVLHTLNLRLHPDELAYIINHGEELIERQFTVEDLSAGKAVLIFQVVRGDDLVRQDQFRQIRRVLRERLDDGLPKGFALCLPIALQLIRRILHGGRRRPRRRRNGRILPGGLDPRRNGPGRAEVIVQAEKALHRCRLIDRCASFRAFSRRAGFTSAICWARSCAGYAWLAFPIVNVELLGEIAKLSVRRGKVAER